MKNLIFVIIIIFGHYIPSLSQSTRLQLGNGFYYIGDSMVHQILFLPSFKDTVTQYFSQSKGNKHETSIKVPIPKVTWVVISNVTSFCFNTKYVLASSQNGTNTSYWIIDKMQEPNELGVFENEERIILSNITQITSHKFITLQNELSMTVQKIPLHTNRQKN